MTIRVTVVGPLTRAGEVPRVVTSEFRQASDDTLLRVSTSANRTVRRDLGVYAAGWQPIRHETGGRVIVRAVRDNTAQHAATLEMGRRAGAKMPPDAPIRSYLIRHGVDQKYTFPTRRKIARFGQPAGHHAERALDTERNWIIARFDNAGRRIARRLGP